ncbi:MAG: hypothetical protein ACO3A4_03650 [Silvanigrellaceae bacterium]
MFWLGTLRGEDYYLRKAFQNNAAFSLWLRPKIQNVFELKDGLTQVTLSGWLNPNRVEQAFAHFDKWIQEYNLLLDETAESAENDAHVLPPFPLPPTFEDDSEGESVPEVDPYDTALADLLGDFWSSGFVTLLGSAHLNVPIIAKPVSGWMVALAHSRFSSMVLEAIVEGLPLRADRGDIPSWLQSVPFAQVDNDPGESLVHEMAIDLGGREIGELFARLCELENLSERYCESEGQGENPLLPIFAASEQFKLQLMVYWSLRGQHFVWSNQKECLLSAISGARYEESMCGGRVSRNTRLNFRDSRQLIGFKGAVPGGQNQGAGMWLNQSELKNSVEKTVDLLEHQEIEGASWLQDYFHTARGENGKRELLGMFQEWQQTWPLWGAEIGYTDSQSGRLLTYARTPVRPGSEDVLDPPAALFQFEFLNGIMGAWIGLPRATVRLSKSIPWQQVRDFWRAESVYQMGWSDQR